LEQKAAAFDRWKIPFLLLTGLFVLTRLAYLRLGVHFDAYPLGVYNQYLVSLAVVRPDRHRGDHAVRETAEAGYVGLLGSAGIAVSRGREELFFIRGPHAGNPSFSVRELRDSQQPADTPVCNSKADRQEQDYARSTNASLSAQAAGLPLALSRCGFQPDIGSIRIVLPGRFCGPVHQT
jgi:hypothetical protein